MATYSLRLRCHLIWHSDAKESEVIPTVIQAKFIKPCASFFTGFFLFSISIELSSSPKPVFIGLSSHITHHNTATCDVRRWTNALFIKYPVYRTFHAQRDTPMYTNLNGFSIRFFVHTPHTMWSSDVYFDYLPVWGSLRLTPINCSVW